MVANPLNALPVPAKQDAMLRGWYVRGVIEPSFRDGPKGPDPESRCTVCLRFWIPGSRTVCAPRNDERSGANALSPVITGLVPVISLRMAKRCLMNRDGRDKPGHDRQRLK